MPSIMRIFIPVALCAAFLSESILTGAVAERAYPYSSPTPDQILRTQNRPSPLLRMILPTQPNISRDSPLASALRMESRSGFLSREACAYIDNDHYETNISGLPEYYSVADNAAYIDPIFAQPLANKPTKNGINASNKSDSHPLRWNVAHRKCEIAPAAMIDITNSINTADAAQDRRLEQLLQRASKYSREVEVWSRKFRLKPDLVYAIMYTESDFNPRLVSSRNAHGLMQIVPGTAGEEVNELFGKKGIPTPQELFDPYTNIKYGTGYFRLLLQRYFGPIRDSLSREYCAIAAYNSGSAPILRVFGATRQEALDNINKLDADEILNALLDRIPIQETRSYLRKVLNARQYFVSLSPEPQNRRTAMNTAADR